MTNNTTGCSDNSNTNARSEFDPLEFCNGENIENEIFRCINPQRKAKMAAHEESCMNALEDYEMDYIYKTNRISLLDNFLLAHSMVNLLIKKGKDLFICGPPGSGKTFFATTNKELSMQIRGSVCMTMLDNHPQKNSILETFKNNVVIHLDFKRILSKDLFRNDNPVDMEEKFYINLIRELHGKLLSQTLIPEAEKENLDLIKEGKYPITKHKIECVETQFNEYLFYLSRSILGEGLRKIIDGERHVVTKIIIIADEVNVFQTKGLFSNKLGPGD